MSKKILNKEQAVEDLNKFLFYIDDWLEELVEHASEQGFNLDFSLESLKDLAKYVRKNNIVNNKENIAEFANCWVYLGETFRKLAANSF